MAAPRQQEAAQLMVAMNRYTGSYARSLVAATPEDQLVKSRKPKIVAGLTAERGASAQSQVTDPSDSAEGVQVLKVSTPPQHSLLRHSWVGSAEIQRLLALSSLTPR